MSTISLFIEKINKFVKENPWIVFFTGLVGLKEIGVLIWKISIWVHEKILSELWNILKEINWDWSVILSVFSLFCSFMMLVVAFYLFFLHDRIYRYRLLKKVKSELKIFCRKLKKKLEWVNEEMEKIFLKNSHELSEAEWERLEKLWEYRQKLKSELGYRKRLLMVC
jgi:hypothetical protein